MIRAWSSGDLPPRPAPAAVTLDTSELAEEEVVQRVLELARGILAQ